MPWPSPISTSPWNGSPAGTRAADVGTRPGPVRDAVAAQQSDWMQLLERLAYKAVEHGELEPDVDPAQLAFELNAVLVSANTSFILHGNPAVFERARAAVRGRLPGLPR